MYKELEKPSFWHLDTVITPDQVGHTVISPLHYGETAEFLFTQGITGTVTINGRSVTLAPKTALFIPPRILHGCSFSGGGGHESEGIYAFHVNLNKLQEMLDLKKILQTDQLSVNGFALVQPHFDVLWETVRGIAAQHNSFAARLCLLLRLFERLEVTCPEDTHDTLYNRHAIRIVEWIEEHYCRKITVEDAAKAFGYSKCYFCKWIKVHTDSSFNELLNGTRINHAVSNLLAGFSVFETAERCGFQDPSYFTKVFKRTMGITPLTFLKEKGSDFVPSE